MQLLTDDDLLDFTGKQESQFIINPVELAEKVQQRLDGIELIGDTLPWSKTHNLVRLRPSEVSIWAGINGHGKSQILNQVCAWGLKKNKWLIASMEMLPEATMARMVRQVSGCKEVNPDYMKRFLEWTTGRLYLYDQTDSVKADRLLGLMRYACLELGVQHIVIDSLMKCGIRRDDYDKQAEFVDRLCWVAKSLKCHIHLVHHIRKGENENKIPNKFDIRGAGEITDLVDNVFIIWRNKGKESKKRSRKGYDETEADCLLINDKQRHGEEESAFKLWFHKDSMQYTPDQSNKPIPWRTT